MRGVSAWNEVVGVEKTMFELVEYDQEQDLVVWLAFGPRGGRELMRSPGARWGRSSPVSADATARTDRFANYWGWIQWRPWRSNTMSRTWMRPRPGTSERSSDTIWWGRDQLNGRCLMEHLRQSAKLG